MSEILTTFGTTEKRDIKRVRVLKMWETCERTTFFVELTNDAGETITPEAFATGSVYTNHEGLSIEEARDRALIQVVTWAAFFGIKPEPYVDDGVAHEASMTLHHYGERRFRRRDGGGS